jgi:hypothetical protein
MSAMQHSTPPPIEVVRPATGWARPLARPVLLRSGSRFVTLADVRSFLCKRLNDTQPKSSSWQRVTALLLCAARSDEVDVADVTIALEMAASMDAEASKSQSG